MNGELMNGTARPNSIIVNCLVSWNDGTELGNRESDR